MEKVRIVIEVDKEELEYIKRLVWLNDVENDLGGHALRWIAKGIPLPDDVVIPEPPQKDTTTIEQELFYNKERIKAFNGEIVKH